MSSKPFALERALAKVQPAWTAERAAQVRSAMLQRRRRRRTTGFAAGGLAVLALVVSLRLFLRQPGNPTPMPPAVSSLAGGGEMELPDGSHARLLASDSALTLVESVPSRLVLRLRRGGAHFDVVPNPARRFRVEAGQVAVEVLGMRFAMERHASAVRVSVAHGRVQVLWPFGQALLLAGQSMELPDAPASSPVPAYAEPPVPPPARTSHAPEKHAAPGRPPRPADPAPQAAPDPAPAPASQTGPDWLSLAREGRFEQAYTARKGALADDPAQWWQWADVARFSHHPAEAVAPLQRIVKERPDDPRAPLAAFTLGRLLLEELGAPREAAEAFSATRALAPRGPLVEDALAREVEAWSRVGETDKARQRALEYLESYPKGRRSASVRRHGGLK